MESPMYSLYNILSFINKRITIVLFETTNKLLPTSIKQKHFASNHRLWGQTKVIQIQEYGLTDILPRRTGSHSLRARGTTPCLQPRRLMVDSSNAPSSLSQQSLNEKRVFQNYGSKTCSVDKL